MMRILSLLFTTMFLQGCVATSYVIDKAKRNFNFFPIDVESARFDDAQKEFVLCVIDLSDAQKKGGGRFKIKIPQDIIEKGGNDRFSLRRTFVLEEVKKGDKLDERFQSYKYRETIHAYDLSDKFLSTNAEGQCKGALNPPGNIVILRVPNDISPDDAMLFKGEAINRLIAKKKPFVVFVHDNLIPKKFGDQFQPQLSPCEHQHHSCLMLVTKPQSDAAYPESTTEQKIVFSEILSITGTVQPKPVWYMLIPFSIALDAAIDGAILLLFPFFK